MSKWYLTTFIIYYLLHGTFCVFSNVVVFVSAVLNDFLDSCDVQADGGKKKSLSVSYSVGQMSRRLIFLVSYKL